jgi:uncharacterized SAM-binding protein YcdF (DUF218 family)
VSRIRDRLRGRRFSVGIACGCLGLLAARYIVNHTPVVDWLVAPLMLPDTTGTADAIVVLGAGVIRDCVPNQSAIQRVLLAARLWRARRATLVVFTGGTGGSCPVAVAMAQLAREVGIPESSIHLETASKSTRENALASTELLHRLNVRRPLLVTDGPHMRRAAAVFAKLGFDVQRASVPIYVYAGLGDNVWLLEAGLREFVALGYYRMRGWVGAGSGFTGLRRFECHA